MRSAVTHPPTFAEQARADAQRLKEIENAQIEFDFLMPFSDRRTLLSVQEVCACIGRGDTFVYEQVQNGNFEAHGTLADQKQRLRITRRSVLLWLARTAQYEPQYFMDRLLNMIDALTSAQCEQVIKRATARRSRL